MNQRAKVFDVIKRSLEGPVCSEQDFDMIHIHKNIKNIAKKYEIKVSEDTLINFDDEMAGYWENYTVRCTGDTANDTDGAVAGTVRGGQGRRLGGCADAG